MILNLPNLYVSCFIFYILYCLLKIYIKKGIGNIHSNTSQSDLESIFSRFGPIESIRILSHRNCGFVNFAKIEDAMDAKRNVSAKDLISIFSQSTTFAPNGVKMKFARFPSAIQSASVGAVSSSAVPTSPTLTSPTLHSPSSPSSPHLKPLYSNFGTSASCNSTTNAITTNINPTITPSSILSHPSNLLLSRDRSFSSSYSLPYSSRSINQRSSASSLASSLSGSSSIASYTDTGSIGSGLNHHQQMGVEMSSALGGIGMMGISDGSIADVNGSGIAIGSGKMLDAGTLYSFVINLRLYC